MKSKIALFFILVLVCWLGITYQLQEKREKSETLVADAYYGDLLAVKDDIENRATRDATLCFNDSEREYKDVEFNALHAAASSGNEDVINFLLDQGMDINAQTPDGWTPLFIATRDGNAEAAKLLIFRQADLNVQTNLGATALLMAVTQPYPSEKDRLDLLAYMLRHGADPNLSPYNGFSPLYYAAVTGNLDVVKILVEYGAQVTPQLVKQTRLLLHKKPSSATKKIAALLQKRAAEK
ncbi:MAG: ankyrin repeat domain-containing protein [Elusimicrobiaceae bacterium]|nr:ankyrin repeat domain-containing protein [Elusimicrobiaceae bacterium]